MHLSILSQVGCVCVCGGGGGAVKRIGGPFELRQDLLFNNPTKC